MNEGPHRWSILGVLLAGALLPATEWPVDDVAALRAALASAAAGDRVVLAAGRYTLDEPLAIPAGVTVAGAGATASIIAAAEAWDPGVDDLPLADDPAAYLVSLGPAMDDVGLEDLGFTGALLHGAVYADDADGLVIRRCRFEDFRWSALRCFTVSDMVVDHCVFIDAGGRHRIGDDGGYVSGGAFYGEYTVGMDFGHNLIERSEDSDHAFYGFKGEQARRTRIHHNDIRVNFSIELPFFNDQDVEIDHNRLAGVVSVPKAGGGPVPESGITFHLHHNWLQSSYALEGPRNGLLVEYNLFDFDPGASGGNLLTVFNGSGPATGPTILRFNRISNPGLGLAWSVGGQDQVTFSGNHVRSGGTWDEGLFGLNAATDYATLVITDNVFEILTTPRPLIRSADLRDDAVVVNNTFIGDLTDAAAYANPTTGDPIGPGPFDFYCGVDGQYHVVDWTVTSAAAVRTVSLDPVPGWVWYEVDGKAPPGSPFTGLERTHSHRFGLTPSSDD